MKENFILWLYIGIKDIFLHMFVKDSGFGIITLLALVPFIYTLFFYANYVFIAFIWFSICLILLFFYIVYVDYYKYK